MTPGVQRLAGVIGAVALAAVLGIGFWMVGMPGTRRLERLDERRLSDLQRIHREIQRVVLDPDRPGELRQSLPISLEEAGRLAVFEELTTSDPASGEPYGYRVLDARTYELEATFALPRQAEHEVFWNHSAGRTTFRIDVLELERFR